MVALLVSCGKIGSKSEQQGSEIQTEQADQATDDNADNSNDNTDKKANSKSEPTEQKKDSADKKDGESQLIINNVNVGEKLSDIDSLNNRVVELEGKTDELAKSVDDCYFCKYGIVAYIVYALAIIVLFIILRIIWMVATAKSPEVKKAEENRKRQLEKRINGLEIRFGQLESKLNSIDQKVKNIDNDVKSIGDNVVYAGAIVPEETSSSQSQYSQGGQSARNIQNHQTVSSHQPRAFYLKFPGTDGNFDNTPVSKSEGYYRFVLDSRNPNLAHFYFEPGDPTSMSRAINNRTFYIEKACEPVSTVDGKVTSCRGNGNSYGEARLENGKWIVNKKQEVRYE